MKLSVLNRMVTNVWNHPSNESARLKAIARGIYHLICTRLLRLTTQVRLGDNSYIYVERERPASSRVVTANPPDTAPMRYLAKVIRPDDLFVDVGANIGIYSVYAADLGANPISIEPGDISSLKRNLELNSIDAEIISAAISNRVGKVRFSTDADQADRIVSISDASVNESTFKEVDTLTLDSIIGNRSARVIKIDVEGFERYVLEGMSKILKDQRVDALQLEWNRACESAIGETREPTARLLRSYGYGMFLPRDDGTLVRCSDGYQIDESVDIFALSSKFMKESGLSQ